MGEGIIARAPYIIRSVGLGSCIAVALYDLQKKIGGFAHIMLPDSRTVRCNAGSKGSQPVKPAYMCADTALVILLEGMQSHGAALSRMTAKIAGGACMFLCLEGETESIGERNIEAVKHLLGAKGIPLAGFDIGGNHGRNIDFFLQSGRLLVKSIGREDKEI